MEKQRCFGCMQLKSGNPICEHCGYDARTGNLPHQLKPGTVLQDQYVVGRALGQGGFGITYMGWDRFLDIPVAIKEFFPNGVVARDTTVTDIVSLLREDTKELYANNRERFIREATSLARLGRNTEVSHIVRVQNLVQANSTAYIIMEYVDGTDLRGYVRKKGGVLAIGQTLEMLLPLMEDLGKVHESHIVHRDISPDNIMVLPNGTTKLIDFGAAHEVSLDTNGIERSTEAILKYGFAPIEQYQRRGGLGSWTDVYALCATIYYCVSGKVPPHATDRLIGDEDFEWDTIPGTNPKLLSVLKKGTAIRKEDRIRTMEELREALLQSMQEETVKNPEPVIKPKKPVADREVTPLPPRKDEPYTAPLVFPKETEQTVPVDFKPGGELFTAPVRETEKSPWWRNRKIAAVLLAAAAAMALLVWKPAEVPDAEERQTSWVDNELWNMTDDEAFSEDKAVPVFGSNLMRDEIASITFLDTLSDEPEDSWDVSRQKNGSVKAWVIPNGELYDLYIGAEGGINANACRNLFRGYRNVKKIQFDNAFHTQQAEDMSGMFYDCRSLLGVNVSQFDTGNVSSMANMFRSCSALGVLYLTSFDTGNVTDMSNMFDECRKMAYVDVSSFNTGNVTNMRSMFESCFELVKLNVSGFEVGNETDIHTMFWSTGKLDIEMPKFNRELTLFDINFMDSNDTFNGRPWEEIIEELIAH